MKKIYLLLSLAAVVVFSFTNPSPDFEGKIIYSIFIDGANLPPQAKSMFEGSEMTTYIKDTKSRTDMNMGMQNTTTISDGKTQSSVMLMDIMGNKYKIKMDESAKKDSAKKLDVTVRYLDDTKEIAGYKCKKAEVSFKDKSGATQSSTIYYTEAIANCMGYNAQNAILKDIKGMPLEYEFQANGMKLKMTAKSISKESVPESKFDIPGDYKETTPEDMLKAKDEGTALIHYHIRNCSCEVPQCGKPSDFF